MLDLNEDYSLSEVTTASCYYSIYRLPGRAVPILEMAPIQAELTGLRNRVIITRCEK